MIIENSNRPVRRPTAMQPLSTSVMGKLPPQARDLEEAVLGALMLEKDALMEISDFMQPEMFYVSHHQTIFKAILKLFHDNSPIDILTITQQLRNTGELEMVGGAYLITELTNRVASAANIVFHARIIMQKFLQREIIRIGTEAITHAYEDTTDTLELLERVQNEVFRISGQTHRKDVMPVKSLVSNRIELLKKPKLSALTGLGTGYPVLDAVSSGWQRSDLTIIAARPAMGKTAFVLNCARNAAIDYNAPVVVFSLEMSAPQLVDRLISSESNIRFSQIQKNELMDWEMLAIEEKTKVFDEAKIIIDDTPGLNIFEFRAKCRRLKKQYGIELIIVDYLQLMTGKNDGVGQNREQEISSISRALKMVAKELDVPVLALSQLSRAVESRPGANKKPQLSDLRESGSIEQDADNVLFLFRPEYYGLEQLEDGTPTRQLMQVIWAKNRNGETGVFNLGFNGAFMRVFSWEHTVNGEKVDGGKVLGNANRPKVDHDKSSVPDDELPF